MRSLVPRPTNTAKHYGTNTDAMRSPVPTNSTAAGGSRYYQTVLQLREAGTNKQYCSWGCRRGPHYPTAEPSYRTLPILASIVVQVVRAQLDNVGPVDNAVDRADNVQACAAKVRLGGREFMTSGRPYVLRVLA